MRPTSTTLVEAGDEGNMMSGIVVLTALLGVFWLALGRPRLGRQCACHNGRSMGGLGSLITGVVALAVFGRLVEHLFVMGLVIAGVGFAAVVFLFVMAVRARR